MLTRAVPILLVALAACSAPQRRAIPELLATRAAIPGIPSARFWGDLATDEQAKAGYAWVKAPPGFEPPEMHPGEPAASNGVDR